MMARYDEFALPNEYCLINQWRISTVLAIGQPANENLFAFYEERHRRRLASFLKAESLAEV